MIQCAICNIAFIKKAHNARYCSTACRLVAKTITTRKWIRENKQKLRDYNAEYYLQNKDRKIARDKEYRQHKMATDINYKLRQNLRKRMCKAVRNNQKAGSAVQDLGCSIEELKIHLESKFQPGMTWENWGRGKNCWHIDHIKPLSSFDLTDRNQYRTASHYTNLQPLWETDNLQKNCKESS